MGNARSTMTSIVSVIELSQSERRADKCEKKKGGHGTIFLHVQRRRRIVLVDSGPVVQKPVIMKRKKKGSVGRQSTSIYSTRAEREKKEGKKICIITTRT